MLQPLPRSSASDLAGADLGFDLKDVVNFLWRGWKLISVALGIATLAGLIFLLDQTPEYTATVQVLLDPHKEKAGGAERLSTFLLEELNLDSAAFESEMAIIQSTALLQRVVESTRPIAEAELASAKTQRSSFLRLIGPYLPGRAGVRPARSETDHGDSANAMAAVGRLKKAMSVSRVGASHVLSISFTSTDRVRAAQLANAIADSYVVDKLDARFEAAQKASLWLSDRLTGLRKQLRQSEEAVAQFRADHGLVQAGNVTLNQQQLSELNAKLVAARAEVAEKKARVDHLRSNGDGPDLPDSANSSILANLRQQEVTASQREADLRSRYSETHPAMINVRAERRDIQRAIAAEKQRLIASAEGDLELAKARVAALGRSLGEATGQIGIDDRTAISLHELERTAAANKSLFQDFLQRAKLTEEESTFEAREARIITPASPPMLPSYPRTSKVMGLALFIGLVVGVGSAFAKEMFKVGFTTPKQIEEILELPLLASVSRLSDRDLNVDGRTVTLPLYPALKPLSRYSEAVWALRSGIQMSDVDDPPKIIEVTSALPGEGKTTIALSLAVSAAASGLKVLVVDADLRHPSASRMLGFKNTTGLVDVLMGAARAQDAVHYWEEGKLWILTCGSRTQNPQGLLTSDRMKALIPGFKSAFDLVVLDTPPVGPVIDPIAVAQLADKVVLVVRWASTERELVHQAVQQLAGRKKVAGVVFNLVDEQEAQKYGKYAYRYYHGSRSYGKYYKE